jgi:hypothetical protein
LYDFRAAYFIASHFCDSNERVIVVEGQLTLRRESGAAAIDIGGLAFFAGARGAAAVPQLEIALRLLFDTGRQARFTPS